MLDTRATRFMRGPRKPSGSSRHLSSSLRGTRSFVSLVLPGHASALWPLLAFRSNGDPLQFGATTFTATAGVSACPWASRSSGRTTVSYP